MAALVSDLLKPPPATLPRVEVHPISETSLGRLTQFAEGASSLIFRATVADPSVLGFTMDERSLVEAEAAAQLAVTGGAVGDGRTGGAVSLPSSSRRRSSANSSNSSKSSKSSADGARAGGDGVMVAVKLARSREGQIFDDVEAELKLLYAIGQGARRAAARSAQEKRSSSSSSQSKALAPLSEGSGAAAGAVEASGRRKGGGSSGTSGGDEGEGGESEYDFGPEEDVPGSEAWARKRRELASGGANNVIRMLGAGLYHDLRRYLVFEYCASTLENLLDVAEKPPPANQQRSGSGWGSGAIGGLFSAPARPQISLARALKLGFELSLAVSYLHTEAIEGHVVLHRDIKPSNVGLTSTGSVRLLDLGLARVVPIVKTTGRAGASTSSPTSPSTPPSLAPGAGAGAGSLVAGLASAEEKAALAVVALERTRSQDASQQQKPGQQKLPQQHKRSHRREPSLLPRYEMTGYTGSLRYMAPEVATNQAYDESVDVYSLALVLWEIASLERPYRGYNKSKFFERVVRNHERPPLDHPDADEWPGPFRTILRDGWAFDPEQRPSACGVSEGLLQLVVEQRYRDSVSSEAEQFEIPPLFASTTAAGGLMGTSGLVSRLSEMALGSRRGSEAMGGEGQTGLGGK